MKKETRKNMYALVNSNLKKKSIANKCYNSLVIFMIVLSVVPLCFKETMPAFKFIDIAAGVLFLIDYVLRWITADFKYKYKEITDKKAFLIYPFRLHAIIDLLAIMSTLPAFIGGMKALVFMDAFKLFRVLKGFRIFKLLKYSESFDIIYVILKKQKKVLMTVFFIAIFYIFISAVLVFQIEPETFPRFFDALYWSVISLTTVGYGDIYPVSEIGRLFSMISAFFGIAFVALPAGIISGGYLEVIMEKKGEDKQE